MTVRRQTRWKLGPQTQKSAAPMTRKGNKPSAEAELLARRRRKADLAFHMQGVSRKSPVEIKIERTLQRINGSDAVSKYVMTPEQVADAVKRTEAGKVPVMPRELLAILYERSKSKPPQKPGYDLKAKAEAIAAMVGKKRTLTLGYDPKLKAGEIERMADRHREIEKQQLDLTCWDPDAPPVVPEQAEAVALG